MLEQLHDGRRTNMTHWFSRNENCLIKLDVNVVPVVSTLQLISINWHVFCNI